MERSCDFHAAYNRSSCAPRRFICLHLSSRRAMNYIDHMVIILEIFGVLTMSLNLLACYTGLLTLAHGAFFGIGAYIAALLMVTSKCGFYLASLGASLGTAVIATILGFASLYFRGDRFVLATL